MTEPILTHLLDLDRTVHEPARLLLLAQLSIVEQADFVYLTKTTGLTDGNISSHMGRLRDAGYATICKEFVGNRPRTVYALTSEGRSALSGYLETVRAAATALLPD